MKVKLLVEYVGRETGYKTFPAGSTLRLDQQPAIELIAAGAAVEYKDEPERVMEDEFPATEPHLVLIKEKVKNGKNKS